MIESNNLPNQPALPQVTIATNINLKPPEIALIQGVHPGYEKIIVEKEFGGGFSGTRVFLILPVKSNGAKDARIVTKIGPAPELFREKENYDNYAGPALPFTATQIKRYCKQGKRAALNYVFTGGDDLGETISLEDYYNTHTTDAINKTLSLLLAKALGGTWYGQNEPLHDLFRTEYGRHLPAPDRLEEIVKAIFPNVLFVAGNRIQITGMTGTYPNPLKTYPALLDKTLAARRSFVHGDLHLRNVLVDQFGKSWLIDFAKITQRHNLFDFIKMEIYVRLMALAQVSGAFSLDEYVQFEQLLNDAALGRSLTLPNNLQLKKAYQVISNIRQIARKYMGPEPDFKNEYFPALFLYGLAMIKYYQPNNPSPTRLIYITTCSLAIDIFEERKIMKPINEESDDTKKSSTPQPALPQSQPSYNATLNGSGAIAQGKEAIAVGERGVHIGGDASNNIITTGDGNNISQTAGTSVNEIAKAFATIREKASQERELAKKEDALDAVKKLKAEADRGEQAEEGRVQRWFAFLAEASADAWDVAVTTLSNPGLGLGTAFKKIVQRAKEEREKRLGA